MTHGLVRSFILTLAALFLAASAFAQTGVGIKGGVSFSRLDTTPDSSDVLDPLTDFTAGVFVAAGGPIGGQVEALVSRRGAEIDGDLFGLGFLGNLAKFRITYLDLSGLLRVNAGAGGNTLYLLAGPTISLELESEISLAGFGQDIGAATESWDVAATVGAGVEVRGFLVEGRYSHGLRDVIVGGDILPFDAKMRSFSVLAGFRF
jgi:hypothetical protein